MRRGSLQLKIGGGGTPVMAAKKGGGTPVVAGRKGVHLSWRVRRGDTG